ncbi:hypothetical protein EC841_11415 [Raoultella ornithinolytica]|uniref:Uncharacterized protein n=1 Tax=Raoultella ornithinolytica TaxID=54291 RepID=A0ABD7QC63_RAOOR|nr:hypothetical protein EC841_11415 [Raoultella ornithinolytica]
MRPFAVIFSQPALGDFSCFIQGPEQLKIPDFYPIRPVEPFDRHIPCWLTRLDKFQRHTMVFSPLRKCQRHKFRAIIHPHLQRISKFCHYPVQYPHYPLGRDIQVDFYGQRFVVKIVYHIEGRIGHRPAHRA